MKIKLSELRQIVKSIINEQAAAQPSPEAQAMTAELAKMKNVPVRWYNEEANTSQYGVMMVKDIFPMANKIKIVGRFESFDKDSEIFYECGKSNFTYMQYPLYNKKYVEKLKSLVCTKSAGGTDVINIGDYSSTTSNAPVNVAESKKKKVFKEQIQIPGYAGGMTQVDIPDGILDKYAPSISIDKLPAILGKIQPCLEQAAVRDINDFIQNYPNTFGLILKTIGSKTLPGISEMGMVASEIMGGGFDFSKLTPLLTCILSKVK